MQFNYYFLRHLSQEIAECITGMKLTACFSQNKDELIFLFESDEKIFHLKANLDGQASLLSFPQHFARAKRNSVDLFDAAIQQRVAGVRQYINERCFSIILEDCILLFKLHGRRGNILLYQKKRFVSMFKKELIQDAKLQLDSLDRPIDHSIESWTRENYNLRILFPTFDKTILRYLTELSFEEASPTKKNDIISHVLALLDQREFYLYEPNQEIPKLSLIPIEGKEQRSTFASAIEISNRYAQAFFTNYQFSKEKQSLLKQLEKEKAKAHNYITNTQNKIHEIQHSRKYDELANILMANLHVPITREQNSIRLFDFYTNEEIEIKIKPKTTLQQSAEGYYRKAKNQGIELDTAKKNLGKKTKQLKSLNEQIDQINEMDDLRALRTWNKSQSKDSQSRAAQLPFLHFVIDGYEVLLGKNAKNNDLLTQKYARKNDLWLHAKDVSGSHVVIRNLNHLPFPKHVIEQAATLAAWYSKRKNDTLCPVIYTLKKYVRKPKGSLPGQVLVDREEVVMVKPTRQIND
ncbi:hypothetical protein BFP72_07840 [Reichenbachiella sp. 5M10]|uniref:NFACT RNA binding domain-containing protein n=1 Tax=Reichenbachiella sp. 5M10 TaxID=1889772 RepID=UPI000C15EEF9|nr:NFACT RNA binding domain-containing protein [Reichenbachiella sp. 5M10]PIB35315.1 hypothetical protein BFP72_07840 [Reichenbachiella sp. 5M10]